MGKSRSRTFAKGTSIDLQMASAKARLDLPEKIYVKGDGLKEFQRTISRLNEMTDRRWMIDIQKLRLDRTI